MNIYSIFFLCSLLFLSCSSKIATEEEMEDIISPTETGQADVVSVSTSGESNNYQFAVGISSPDVDCNQYANWWEIVSAEGELIYRRILTHSHPSEQPFVRSGGPVAIGPDERVIVRAHMHPVGYGGTAYEGTISGGFEAIQKPADFASDLNEQEPLPTVCTS